MGRHIRSLSDAAKSSGMPGINSHHQKLGEARESLRRVSEE